WVVDELDDPVPLQAQDAETRHALARNRHDPDRDLGAIVDMSLQERSVIHLVEMVPGQDEDIVAVARKEADHLLADGIGSALIPIRALLGLLGGEDLDEALREGGEAKRVRDVAVQRSGLKLRQHEDLAEPRVDRI